MNGLGGKHVFLSAVRQVCEWTSATLSQTSRNLFCNQETTWMNAFYMLRAIRSKHRPLMYITAT